MLFITEAIEFITNCAHIDWLGFAGSGFCFGFAIRTDGIRIRNDVLVPYMIFHEYILVLNSILIAVRLTYHYKRWNWERSEQNSCSRG